ncbi:UV excision repair protein RAD23 [Monoraphidium neglectum]|uniref:UV excision repair protein RAD23 n=1 Tax=Monoraphidium neglectum TaxID=145388 RepID=A0A0D2JTT0_9CHLO|nr:UV excision repair protein RAD23 [Monoraphidium neglectum]KIZ02328.1 UV excision repair protein RAD23 [Monoraphidium neglectum]|eukprot:XP_013901347.1 UV excision repair protein RAD23 [Monoraphidium neglectum]
MELTFRTIGGKSFKIEAEPSATVGELKAKVEASQPECPAAQLKLVYKGKVLEPEDKAISELNVDSTGFLVCFVQKAAAPKPAAAEPKPAAAPAAAEPAAEPAAGAAGGSAPAAPEAPAAAAAPEAPAAATRAAVVIATLEAGLNASAVCVCSSMP